MKYLKEYKIFENDESSDVIDYVNDILIDLKDDGFDIDLEGHHLNEFVTIEINKKDTKFPESDNPLLEFKWGEIKLTIEQLLSYLKSMGDVSGINMHCDIREVGYNLLNNTDVELLDLQINDKL
jgi:hypothetical protein